ncbi:hypothetical protein EKD04_025075 [Chloroflexales bacterium ZM16-3]|nr:hypothetical protein [Chloroflexales bacterium ZM16-3]
MPSSAILSTTELDHKLGEITGDRARLDQIRTSGAGRVPYLTTSGEVGFTEPMHRVNVGAAAAKSGPGGHLGMTLPADGHAWIELGPSSSSYAGFTPNTPDKIHH